MNEIPPDVELIERIRARQGWALDALYERYCGPVRSHLIYFLGNESEAEDLVQEVFLRIWTRAEQWTGQGLVRGWMFRIATNLALNQLRSRRRRPEQPLEAPHFLEEENELEAPDWLVDVAGLGPDAVYELAEQNRRLQQMIQELPEEKREVFRLVHQYEMSLQDAADELGIPVGTAKSRLYYARERLGREWRAWQAGQE
jgi:RNA polymerase sigma-70 factor, ECF subfamily